MDHLEALLALRSRLNSVVVATTGSISLTGTGTGFTRTTGSFVGENFKVGMEVVPSGFTDNTPAIIESLTALEIKTNAGRVAEAIASGRSLIVGIPPLRGWENKRLDPIDGRWNIEEDYLPGPSTKIGVTAKGPMQHLPQYVLRLSGLSNRGPGALYTVSKAIMDAFPPGYALDMADGQPLRVSTETAPYRGQILPVENDPGHVQIVITIPLWKRTQNPI